MNQFLKILHLEDLAADAEIIKRELEKAGLQFEVQVVDNKTEFVKALKEFSPDIIISDHSLPSFDSLEALKIIKNAGIEIPFILVTATTSEEFAVSVIKAGANDYILKDRIQRLPGAVLNTVEKHRTKNERKKMEDDLLESQVLLSNVINSAMDGIITVDESQNIVMVNPSTERIFRYEASELIGKPLDKIIPERFREMHRKHVGEFGRTGISARRAHALTPLTGVRSNGQEFPLEISISQVHIGEKKLYTAIFRDVTEKLKAEKVIKSSEERYRLLFHNNPLPMWVYDLQSLEFLDVNDAVVEKYGYSREEFFSMTIKDIRPPEDAELLNKYLADSRDSLTQSGIWRHKKKDGTIINVEITSHTINFGGVPSRLVLANDITEKIRAVEELKSSREGLRALAAHLQSVREEERTAIAREIHDELGQVLTSLKINLTIIGKSLSSSVEKIDIKSIDEEINGMKGRIDTTIKRLRELITKLRPEVLDNLGLIPAFEWLTNEFQSTSGIQCELINNVEEEFKFNQDVSIALFRIFQEALTNVARHAYASKVILQLNKNGNILSLEIIDDGIGIKESNIKTNKSFGLLGMKERALILGGDFKIEAFNPKGTKISVNVPIK
jgi:two-component system sensor histidine kinase UhpB